MAVSRREHGCETGRFIELLLPTPSESNNPLIRWRLRNEPLNRGVALAAGELG